MCVHNFILSPLTTLPLFLCYKVSITIHNVVRKVFSTHDNKLKLHLIREDKLIQLYII